MKLRTNSKTKELFWAALLIRIVGTPMTIWVDPFDLEDQKILKVLAVSTQQT